MSSPTASNPDLLDSDIVRLFEKQGSGVSPDDLDKRILGAAAIAVNHASADALLNITQKKRWPSILWLMIVLLILAMLYPVLESFLELPNKVQNSARIFSQKPANLTLVKE